MVHNGYVTTSQPREQEFFELAERFRHATDPAEVRRLGDQTGRMVFGADAKGREAGQPLLSE
jgi:hypothetical protein